MFFWLLHIPKYFIRYKTVNIYDFLIQNLGCSICKLDFNFHFKKKKFMEGEMFQSLDRNLKIYTRAAELKTRRCNSALMYVPIHWICTVTTATVESENVYVSFWTSVGLLIFPRNNSEGIGDES